MFQCLFKLDKREEAIDYYNKALEYAKSDYDRFECNKIIGKCYFDNV